MALRDKLTTTNEQILAGKKAVADALIQVGITAVEPNPNVPDKYETFQSYADKIKRLMISNSLILEYRIPEEGFENLTKYKRTIMLPMSGVPIDDTAIAIINSDTAYTPSNSILSSTLATNKNINELENSVTDIFGNIVHDGTIEYVETQEDRDARAYWDSLMEQTNEPSLLTLEDKYAFTVDWGDGSEPQEFISLEETPDVWYHEYTKPGTYTVSINGVYKIFSSYPAWSGNLIIDGEYFRDKDGEIILRQWQYATNFYLRKIIAWGNTQLENISQCCIKSRYLQSIPMLDTTNSFANVIAANSCWYGSVLSYIPYDSNTERGLFSNCEKLTSVIRLFEQCNFNEEIPPLLFQNCTELSNISYAFSLCRIIGNLPSTMFAGLPALINAERTFNEVKFNNASLPSDIFNNCKGLHSIKGLFYESTLIGELPSGLFKNCSNLSYLQLAFYNNTGINSIGKDLLLGIESDNVQLGYFISNTNIEEIPEGLFGKLKGTSVWAPSVCYEMPKLKTIPSTLFEEISGFLNCMGMFANCPEITSSCPDEPSNGDFDSYSGISKYFGIFANSTKMADYGTIYKELGGGGVRKFPQYNVGKICLNDTTFVEIEDFVYDPDNKPIGFCAYSDDTRNIVVGLNEYAGYFTTNAFRGDLLSEGCPFVNFSNKTYRNYPSTLYNYSDFSKTAEEYTREFFAWSGYTTHRDDYVAYKWLEEYKVDNEDIFWHGSLPKETFNAIMLRAWMKKACQKIISESFGDFDKSNCYQPGLNDLACSCIGYYSDGCWSCGFSGTYDTFGLLLNSNMMRPFCTIPQS